MNCGKVVYPTENRLISSYCGLPQNHEGDCKYVPTEWEVQICKQLLIDRGELIVPLRPIRKASHCPSMNPDMPTMQCGLPAGHSGKHSKSPYHSWS